MDRKRRRYHPYVVPKSRESVSSENSSSSREKSSFSDSKSSVEQLSHTESSTSLYSEPKTIRFGFLQSAKRCGAQWDIPIPLESRRHMKHMLKVYHVFGFAEELIITRILEANQYDFQWDCISGEKYKVEVFIEDNGVLIATGTITLKARFSMAEMYDLFTKARAFVVEKTKLQTFNVLYRCKPRPYWDQIYEKYDGVMYKYLKDANGQAASPINGTIYGLFFSARTMPDGSLPPTSPFGDVRMTIPAQRILDPDIVNFYFADFYCNLVVHYVTVVVCFKGSDEDKYLKETCILLNPQNQFFHVSKYRYTDREPFKYEFAVNTRVWVEFFFTESFHTSYGHFSKVEAKGLGSARPTGLVHNMACKECNLYPEENYDDDQENLKDEKRDNINIQNNSKGLEVPEDSKSEEDDVHVHENFTGYENEALQDDKEEGEL